jgi:hypothetical protein
LLETSTFSLYFQVVVSDRSAAFVYIYASAYPEFSIDFIVKSIKFSTRNSVVDINCNNCSPRELQLRVKVNWVSIRLYFTNNSLTQTLIRSLSTFPPAAKFIFSIESKCRRRNLNFTQRQRQSNYSCDHYKIYQQLI